MFQLDATQSFALGAGLVIAINTALVLKGERASCFLGRAGGGEGRGSGGVEEEGGVGGGGGMGLPSQSLCIRGLSSAGCREQGS